MTTTMIPAEVVAQPHVQRLLGRSALYEALGLLLAYPEAESLARADVLLSDLTEHEIASAWGLDEALERFRRARVEVDAGRLAPVHFVLFEGSVLCSPHETEYVRDPLAKGAQLADVAGFYAAFGLQVSGVHPTTPDEIATELEFMSLVTRKEAYALVRGWDERAEIARNAGRRFLELHLGRWVSAFAADLCGRADEAAATRQDWAVGTWYHALGDLLQAAVNADMAHLWVHPTLLTTRYADPDADSMVCPMAAEPLIVGEDDIAVEEAIRATRPISRPVPNPLVDGMPEA